MSRKRKADADGPPSSSGELPPKNDGSVVAGRTDLDLRRSGRVATIASSTPATSAPTAANSRPGAGAQTAKSKAAAARANVLAASWPVSDTELPEVKEDKGIQEAVQGLAEMERKLRSATKQQKLKIQQSRIPGGPVTAEGVRNPNADGARDSVSQSGGPSQSESASGAADRSSASGNEYKPESGDQRTKPGRNPPGAAELPDRGAARQPPVNSSYLPVPWEGRLGYACLNTYLRAANPPVFSSRTCRLSSIIDHRHPLHDPSLPEHPVKNRPDKTNKADPELGRVFLRRLGLANARDIVPMVRWNDKYGIRFMRLSSDIFPFASHPEHGYELAPFASDVLADAGRVIADLGHRVTTHPGQFTQLGSPRREVITAAVRDLVYHDEMLSLLRLPPQQDRDAIMVLHMGGTFGDKAATLDRFRHHYKTLLPPGVRARLVLENDDVSWSVHDLLPVCEELSIPLVLDYHHHNIVFDARYVREGTLDISQPELAGRIAETWRRRGITQKMHYSEPRPEAVTARDRRRHSSRVSTLPPCPPDMDLMIEAKDKEQAVFDLMRTFRLPGFDRFNNIIPHEREDESRPAPKAPARSKKKQKKGKAAKGTARGKTGEDAADVDAGEEGQDEGDDVAGGTIVPPEEFGMGGPLNRVYWPVGMEEWLKPMKRGVKRAGADDE